MYRVSKKGWSKNNWHWTHFIEDTNKTLYTSSYSLTYYVLSIMVSQPTHYMFFTIRSKNVKSVFYLWPNILAHFIGNFSKGFLMSFFVRRICQGSRLLISNIEELKPKIRDAFGNKAPKLVMVRVRTTTWLSLNE